MILVANCPRCGARSVTFDLTAMHLVGIEYGWAHTYESFSVCRHCQTSTTFVIIEKTGHDVDLFKHSTPLKLESSHKISSSLNDYFDVRGFIGLKDQGTAAPPEHVPEPTASVFREGATCLNVECWNAAGTMFRMCVDLATRPMLPKEEVPGLNKKVRRDLGLRIPWLFADGKLPSDLHDLSTAIKEDGNDGAHQGTLTRAEAEDLMDFTVRLLERLYTHPKQLEIAKERREKRRAKKE